LFIFPISIFYRNQAYFLRWMRVGVHYRRKWHLLKLFETGLGRYGNVCCCLSFCLFSFGHRVVCSSSMCWFWLPPFGIFKLFT
jgi:hypothetical protein